MRTVQINAPYLLFLGDETRATYVKTAQGLVDWVGDKCAGQYRLTAQPPIYNYPIYLSLRLKNWGLSRC